jgi:hypothetical protein
MSTGVIEKKEFAMIPAARLEEARKLSAVAKQSQAALIGTDDPIIRTVVLAQAAQLLRESITPGIMNDFRALMNTPLGFRTDRGRNPGDKTYDDATVKDILIQAMVRGLRPTGNEFNIIAGNLYITKEGYKRLIRDFPGLTNLHIDIGTPKAHGEGAIVPCKATWKLHGIDQSMDCTGEYSIAVKGVGVDLLVGKAESKMLRRIYARLAGSDLATPEEEELISHGEAMQTELEKIGFESTKGN